MDVRLAFMGTPDFAVPVLKKLAEHFQIVGVITQPDRPSGRGKQLVPSPVKAAADGLHLAVVQPQDTNSISSLDIIRSWKPDLICVAAFGQILSPELLAIPPKGCLNVHASLLPRWRGASPISAAILYGDSASGITIMRMAPGLDDGPILSQKSLQILPDDTAGTLSDRLSFLGADLLADTIFPYLKGNLQPQAQDPALVTYARQLKKQDGRLDFSQSAHRLALKVRAFMPWPGTFTFWKDLRLIVHQAKAVSVSSPGEGVFTTYKDYPAIGTGEGILVLIQLQLAGKKALSGLEFLHGTPEWQSPV